MRTTVVLMCLVIVCFPAGTAAGDLDPEKPPGPTMKTLDEIPPTWSQILDSTDGDPTTGCDSSRFKCVLAGEAVLDLETGLVWERVPTTQPYNGLAAFSICTGRKTGGRAGYRLPRIEELMSLIDVTSYPYGLPTGHPFDIGQTTEVWSSTNVPEASEGAWLNITDFSFGWASRGTSRGVWCVRGGEANDNK